MTEYIEFDWPRLPFRQTLETASLAGALEELNAARANLHAELAETARLAAEAFAHIDQAAGIINLLLPPLDLHSKRV